MQTTFIHMVTVIPCHWISSTHDEWRLVDIPVRQAARYTWDDSDCFIYGPWSKCRIAFYRGWGLYTCNIILVWEFQGLWQGEGSQVAPKFMDDLNTTNKCQALCWTDTNGSDTPAMSSVVVSDRLKILLFATISHCRIRLLTHLK